MSLAASLENDVFPSTPLTDEQLGETEVEDLGVPINQVPIYQANNRKFKLSLPKCAFYLTDK